MNCHVNFNVLGIESSCDETAVAIVDADKKIHANLIYSQIAEHTPYAGVVPELASRAHLEHLPRLIRQAFQDTGLGWDDIHGIAATCGPGLLGGLMVGATMAKTMAMARNLPFIAVNHLEGHALTPRLTSDLQFPYLMLLVSGGHCQLLVARGVGDYALLGRSLDDAVGEAFDKVAKMLRLGFPGGPKVEQAARLGDPHAIPLPRPLLRHPSCDFSFSGLKTAVRMYLEQHPDVHVPDLCASFQQAVVDCLLDRCHRALPLARDCKTLVVVGGVAANATIRQALQKFCDQHDLVFNAPPMALCTDNAAMIAWVGVERLRLGAVNDIDMPLRPRWPLAELKG